MIGRIVRTGVAASLFSTAAIVGTVPAFAHGHGRDHGQIVAYRGVISGLPITNGQQQLQLNAKNSTITMNVASTTHVLSIATGSIADLVQGAFVQLHLVKGTTTVDAVRIVPAPAAAAVKKSKHHHVLHAVSTKANTQGQPDKHSGKMGPKGPDTFGQITSVSSTTAGTQLTVQSLRTKSTRTYSLASSVKVTKIVKSSVSDLHVGQKVQAVLQKSNDTAIEILIANP